MHTVAIFLRQQTAMLNEHLQVFRISAYNGEHLKTMYFLSGSSKYIEGAAKLINKNWKAIHTWSIKDSLAQ